MDEATREQLWTSVNRILDQGPVRAPSTTASTGLALGYVQSGKTTSITALIAAAADDGYDVIVALLGSTNLLLDQNRRRLESSLGIGDREDYRWVIESNPSGARATKRLEDWAGRGRTILIPLLKHAGRINAAAGCLTDMPDDLDVLIVDDEADQVSLNTAGQNAESRTYEAIGRLRRSVPRHLYVQYTATPYAPLLLDADDLLSPQFVEFLNPGPGYTGGREFFVDFADRVVRNVPVLEEQATKAPPLALPTSLSSAFASFLSGAALLLANQPNGAPVSMLVHSTARNDVQARYVFLLERQLKAWRSAASGAHGVTDLPDPLQNERINLVRAGAVDANDQEFLERLRYVLRESTLWLVNSASALNKVDWKVAPIHILVGGNKLDRGFTVEGLTVTYMNRPASPQVDTLEQRARAFGYRRDQLPYCQFFASHRTIRSLRDIVYTEYDLRARLRDHIEEGGTIHSWAREVGVLLPPGMKPTRDAVVSALSRQTFGWHSLRRPSLARTDIEENEALIRAIGLEHAETVDYGRLAFRTLSLPGGDLHEMLESWRVSSYSPGWRRDDILDVVLRLAPRDASVPVVLMDDSGNPRVRQWEDETGFSNLFQGRDISRQPDGTFYPGDRAVPGIEGEDDTLALQVHRVVRRGEPSGDSLFTLAIYLGSRSLIRKADK
ncbi:hypothetical protein ACVW00_001009 [Marmoricola sp. URHA0025 HA25]